MSLYVAYTDAELVTLLNNSDREAYAEIYKRYWEKLHVVAANKLNDFHLAQELVQDIFLDLWKRRAELRCSERLAAYLAVALKYKVINARLKRYKELHALKDAANEWDIPDHATEHQLSFDELKGRLAKLVTELPEKCQLVFRLSREEGHSQKQIAQEMQISEKAVEAHLTRALKKLRAGIGSLFSLFMTVLMIICSLSLIFPFK